jgi:5-methyltetrahydrofolate--homocysteine methyltransferase
MPTFLEALRGGRVLLMDGAMGTELQRAGIGPNECYERWNLTHPEKVRAIHQAYADAGAECLLTNTFQANSQALARHGLKEQFVPIAQAGIDLARAVAGPDRFVLLDVGPVEMRLIKTLEMVKAARGADAVLLETWSALDMAANFLRSASLWGLGLPVLVSFTFWRPPSGIELRTFNNCTPEACARMAHRRGAAALGVNCGRDLGMEDVAEVLRRYRAVTDLPLFARPNAGTPRRTESGWMYPQTPAAMAARLPELLAAGATMVGGCCGTTPETIAAFRGRLRPGVAPWEPEARSAGPR